MAKFENSVNILDNIFGIRRIVDAKNKTIHNLDENQKKYTNENYCFDIWKAGKECTNCISMRALNENKSFSKFETIDNKLYMVISAPITIKNDTYVVELVKDISNDTISSPFESFSQKDLQDEIIRLNNLVVTDELTSIFNRRYINEKLPYSLNKLTTNITSLSIIIIDVDKFKYVNDNYGHNCGDFVLKNISSIFKDFTINNSGWVARYGGDEFIMVFENISEEDTYDICSNLKKVIKEKKFIYNNKSINISCSLGMSILTNNDISIDSIFSDIDNKLFLDKNAI